MIKLYIKSSPSTNHHIEPDNVPKTSSISAILQLLEYSDPIDNITQCILWNSSNFHSLNTPQKEVIERMVDFIQFWSIQESELAQNAPHSIINIRFWNSHKRNYSLYSFQWNLYHFIWILDEEVMTVLPETLVYWLASRLVTNPIFHRVYLHNYSESRDEIFTRGTLICLLNTIAMSPSESL